MEMKNYLNLVPISVKVHRRQSKMTRICITLVLLVAQRTVSTDLQNFTAFGKKRLPPPCSVRYNEEKHMFAAVYKMAEKEYIT